MLNAASPQEPNQSGLQHQKSETQFARKKWTEWAKARYLEHTQTPI